MPPKKDTPANVLGTVLSGASKFGLDLLSTSLVDLVPVDLSEKDKKRLRRVARKGLADTVKAVGAAAKKLKAPAAPAPLDLERLKVITACGVLAMPVPAPGKPVDLELARSNKRAAAKLFHPDVAGDKKRDQFEVVVTAYDLLEKYNESLKRGRQT